MWFYWSFSLIEQFIYSMFTRKYLSHQIIINSCRNVLENSEIRLLKEIWNKSDLSELKVNLLSVLFYEKSMDTKSNSISFCPGIMWTRRWLQLRATHRCLVKGNLMWMETVNPLQGKTKSSIQECYWCLCIKCKIGSFFIGYTGVDSSSSLVLGWSWTEPVRSPAATLMTAMTVRRKQASKNYTHALWP